MAFEIEELTKTIKKNPVPWAVGLGVAVVGGYVVFRKNAGSGYVTEAYPEQPLVPEDIASGEAKPGDVTDAQLQELLAELERARHEDLQQLADLNAQFMEGLARSLESYTSQQMQSYPQAPVQAPVQAPMQEPVPQISPELVQKAEYVYQTPSIYFQPKGGGYTPQQVEVMYSWAVEENTAISRGYAGTSKDPVGLAESGMTVTYYPTGHVEFKPKSSSGSGSSIKPTSYVDTPAGRALAEAARREQTGWTSQQVSKVTGKTGTVEQQLSGMSASQKLDTLRKAGLIK